MNKLVITLLIFILPIVVFAQPVVPFIDFNNYLRVFENNNFQTIEFQPIVSYQAGDEFVAYIDNRENLRIFNGKERKDITNLNIKFSISDHLLAYNVGTTLNMWDAGKLRTLSYFVFKVKLLYVFIILIYLNDHKTLYKSSCSFKILILYLLNKQIH
jgi:uncharacterized protein with WD repeat